MNVANEEKILYKELRAMALKGMKVETSISMQETQVKDSVEQLYELGVEFVDSKDLRVGII